MGRGLNADIEVLQAVRAAHPHCLFILDANEGYTSKEAIEVLEKLNGKNFQHDKLAYNKIKMTIFLMQWT